MAIDPLIAEFRAHLEFRFERIRFGGPEMAVASDVSQLRAVWSLRKLVKLLYENFKSAGYSVEWETDTKSEADGFYIRSGTQYLLYVGSWTPIVERSKQALCMGVEHNWIPAVLDTFRSTTKTAVFEHKDGKQWTMTGIPNELLSEDPAAKIFEYIEPTVKQLLAHAATIA